MKIIGLAGKARSGKDTISDFFVQSEKFKKIALATPLKELCSRVFDIDMKYFEDQTLKEKDLPFYVTIEYHHLSKIQRIVSEEWGFEVDYLAQHDFIDFVGTEIKTARKLLQTIGTDMLRKSVKDDIFVDLLFAKIRVLSCDVIVSDVRLKNERQALKKAGASLLLVKREDLDKKRDQNGNIIRDTHISENDLGVESEYDVVINNSDISLGQLRSEVLLWYSVAGRKYE